MGLRIPTGTMIYRDADFSSIIPAITDVRNALVDAGWTVFEDLYEKRNIRFTGGLTDGATLTISKGATTNTYTYRTVPTLPHDILIGTTFADLVNNTVTMLNASDPLVGAVAGAIDSTDPNYSSIFTMVNRITGVHMDIVVATTDFFGNLVVWGDWREGGHRLRSKASSAQPLQMCIQIASTGTNLYVMIAPPDADTWYGTFYLNCAALRTLKVSTNGQELMTWKLGSSVDLASKIHVCVPNLFEGQEPLVITSANNNGTGKFRITFVVPHGMTTGQNIYINQATIAGTYSSSLNGNWQVTVVDSLTLDLDISTYMSGYDSSTGLASAYKRHSRCFFAIGCPSTTDASVGWSFRNNIGSFPGTLQGSSQFLCLDHSLYAANPFNSNGNISLFTLKPALTNAGAKVKAIGEMGAAITAIVGWRWPTDADGMGIIANLPAAIVGMDDIDMDEVFVKSGYNWVNITDNHGNGSLFRAVTVAV